ncbi:hypothetical protein RM844_28140 [Streptomyces sp. DSM 44915]|uniref:WXG100 family type VII secretion target n=1 Tax=Streptomyces chisholmiae TaxID=3075540 RepID=A0ABU2JZG5_9ACTN|nr:hypothetical protein [Streptomyces sp. DSM 44915]MDT0270148.1 hypothetical protein [Streptomyces sp. DSM 44915]
MSFPREPHISDFPALGFVPCAGDQSAMDTVSSEFGDTAEVLGEVVAVLSGADEGEWRGRTAREFRRMLRDDFRPKVEEAYQSFNGAHRAMVDWLVEMGDFQRRADHLERDAAAALAALDSAQAGLDGMPPRPGIFDPEPETDEEREEAERTEEERGRREHAVQAAEAALQQFRERAARLQQDYDQSGQNIAGRLRNAMELAPNEPGFWSSLGDAIGDLAEGFVDLIDDIGAALIDILAEWAPILSKIGSIAGLLSSITGLLAMIPIPGFQVLGVVSLALAAVSVVANYGAAVGETGSFTSALADPNFLLSTAALAFGAGSFAGMKALTSLQVGGVSAVDDVFGFAMRNGSAASSLPGVMGLTVATNVNAGGARFMDSFGNMGTITDLGGTFSGWSRNNSPVRTGS